MLMLITLHAMQLLQSVCQKNDKFHLIFFQNLIEEIETQDYVSTIQFLCISFSQFVTRKIMDTSTITTRSTEWFYFKVLFLH